MDNPTVSTMVRPPGFGPGFLPWQGNVLDQTSALSTETMPLLGGKTWLDYGRNAEQLIINTLIYLENKGDIEITRQVTDMKLKQIVATALRKNAKPSTKATNL